MYDTLHRTLEVVSSTTKSKSLIQKGLRERLLCQACEAKLSLCETHAADIITYIQSLLLVAPGTQLILPYVRYDLFKLFQLSLLWRASVSSRAMFAQIKLGPVQEDIRAMISAGDPGEPYEYPCVMFAVRNPVHIRRMMWSPVATEFEDHTGHQFQIGAVFWTFLIPHLGRGNPQYSVYLHKDGRLVVPIAEWNEDLYLPQVRSLILRDFAPENPKQANA